MPIHYRYGRDTRALCGHSLLGQHKAVTGIRAVESVNCPDCIDALLIAYQDLLDKGIAAAALRCRNILAD